MRMNCKGEIDMDLKTILNEAWNKSCVDNFDNIGTSTEALISDALGNLSDNIEVNVTESRNIEKHDDKREIVKYQHREYNLCKQIEALNIEIKNYQRRDKKGHMKKRKNKIIDGIICWQCSKCKKFLQRRMLDKKDEKIRKIKEDKSSNDYDYLKLSMKYNKLKNKILNSVVLREAIKAKAPYSAAIADSIRWIIEDIDNQGE